MPPQTPCAPSPLVSPFDPVTPGPSPRGRAAAAGPAPRGSGAAAPSATPRHPAESWRGQGARGMTSGWEGRSRGPRPTPHRPGLLQVPLQPPVLGPQPPGLGGTWGWKQRISPPPDPLSPPPAHPAPPTPPMSPPVPGSRLSHRGSAMAGVPHRFPPPRTRLLRSLWQPDARPPIGRLAECKMAARKGPHYPRWRRPLGSRNLRWRRREDTAPVRGADGSFSSTASGSAV